MHYAFDDRLEYSLTKRGEPQYPAADGAASRAKPQRDASAQTQPAWAKGLQRLYDQVVEEELPDDLAKLLAKLDRAVDGA